jgi:hypothetical protein
LSSTTRRRRTGKVINYATPPAQTLALAFAAAVATTTNNELKHTIPHISRDYPATGFMSFLRMCAN